MMYSLTLKTGFIPGEDGVISIELNIDFTNVSFGLMFFKDYRLKLPWS